MAADLFQGQKADFSSFGVAYVPEAAGRRVELTAVNQEGEKLGMFGRLWNTGSLHKIDNVIKSLEYEIKQRTPQRVEGMAWVG